MVYFWIELKGDLKLKFTPDIDLNSRLRNGDNKAFELIYNRYSRELYYFINKYISDRERCDDIIHDSFLNLWNARERIRDSHPVQNYLFRITRNLVFKELRKQINTSQIFKNENSNEELEIHGENCVENSLADKEYSYIYNLAIDTLPPQRKRIFRMSREEGLNYKEIAGNLEISTQTVKEHMSLAMKSIKDYIAKEHDIILKGILIVFFLS